MADYVEVISKHNNDKQYVLLHHHHVFSRNVGYPLEKVIQLMLETLHTFRHVWE